MARHWTFGQRLGAGFALTVALAIATGAVAIYALQDVVEAKDQVIRVESPLLAQAERARTAIEAQGSAIRGFLLTRDESFVTESANAGKAFQTTIEQMHAARRGERVRAAIEQIPRFGDAYENALNKVIELRRADPSNEAVARAFADQVLPPRRALDTAIDEFVSAEQQALEAARGEASDSASSATTLLIAILVAVVVLGIVAAFVLARSLSRQIGTAVGQVQSSSAELQAAANQQATGAKEQATAMNEITTTITELLATSRQIAESAQRVAQIAGQTATSAKLGGTTVESADHSIAGIRRQVEQVVAHMLDLGKKSQEIGSVLDIVSELAEQTNILAINATIEAAGAGEAGKRFGVVADEIRKLADRVTISTKEIRTLIDDVRSAVNTTVMATEAGSKSVEAGSKQFAEVSSAFRQITDLVGTTTEASREIELSTKQQTTAVEQVNLAIASVAQATKETEASSTQTLITVSQLAALSKDLLKLVQPQQLS